MRYKLQVPFANRPDLLKDAIETARDIGNTHVWCDGIPIPFDAPDVTWHCLPPMPSTAVYNMFIQDSWDDDVLFHMHNDAYLEPGVAQKFFDYVQALHNQGDQGQNRWGVVFSNYDVLSAFNMKAVRDVGYWDTMFFQYTADLDYYHRMRLNGWHIREFGREGVIHGRDTGGSSTVKSDPLYNHRVQWRQRTGFDREYFKLKWGCEPTTYSTHVDSSRKMPGFSKAFEGYERTAPARLAHRRAASLKA